MSTEDLARDRVFAEVKRLCYSGLDAATLRERVLARLQRAVPFEGYVAFTMDPSSGLITDMLAQEMGGEREGRHFLEHVCFEDDILEFNWMVRNRLAVGLLSEATGGKLERALRYRELIGPAGFGYELRGAFTTGTELWGGLCLSREKGRPDFATRELAFIRRVAPHLGAGLRAATLQQELHDDQDSDDAAGVLVLDQWGTVVQHNAAAERRLQELGELGARWREGEGLPTPIWTVLGALRKALKAETDRDLNSTPQVQVRGGSGRWLTLQASQTEPSLTRPSESVLVIAPAGPKQVLGLTAIGYGLSPREQEVVDLIVRGASSKQISQALYISEYTVKDHLSNIFEKVGVRGRRELVKRLYLNTILR
ncbi:MAG TPA: LuxR C-terminal-related transcriptional regulator [Acidimicrobiales bacterium]|nr:LuxR C-terminal-related transcriptional regulator [Acidimicrobiales bacterium]